MSINMPELVGTNSSEVFSIGSARIIKYRLDNGFYSFWISVWFGGCLLQWDAVFPWCGQLMWSQIYKCVTAPKRRENSLRTEEFLNECAALQMERRCFSTSLCALIPYFAKNLSMSVSPSPPFHVVTVLL